MASQMDQNLVRAIRDIVSDLVSGRFVEIEADGRAGRLTALELSVAISDYGRTLVPLPEQAFTVVDIYPNQLNAQCFSVDVPLWTVEEGRSDLTLSLLVEEHGGGSRIQITDLHVL